MSKLHFLIKNLNFSIFLIEKSLFDWKIDLWIKKTEKTWKTGKIAKTQIYPGFLSRRHQAGGLFQYADYQCQSWIHASARRMSYIENRLIILFRP